MKNFREMIRGVGKRPLRLGTASVVLLVAVVIAAASSHSDLSYSAGKLPLALGVRHTSRTAPHHQKKQLKNQTSPGLAGTAAPEPQPAPIQPPVVVLPSAPVPITPPVTTPIYPKPCIYPMTDSAQSICYPHPCNPCHQPVSGPLIACPMAASGTQPDYVCNPCGIHTDSSASAMYCRVPETPEAM